MKLAQPGDPLVATNGEIIAAEGRVEPKYTREVPLVKDVVPQALRSLKELGVNPETQSVVNAVLVYQLLGITENEIAYHLNTDVTEIRRIKDLPAYNDTWKMIFQEVISANSNSLSARIQSYAGRALTNLMDLADDKPVEIIETDAAGNQFKTKHYAVPPVVVMKANDSILDRAGLSGEALFGTEKNDNEQQLEIEIVAAGDNTTNVKVNLNGHRSR